MSDDAMVPTSSEADSIGIYIHIPWCRRRCGYCDFNTYVLGDQPWTDTMWPYLQAMRAEIKARARSRSPVVKTIFFGGGTPTLMEGHHFEYILEAVRDFFDVDPQAEITTEANPESLTLTSLKQIRAAGVNRLSLGMQSGVPHVLKTLERSHSPAHLEHIITKARVAGFTNISLDVIYSTPGESM